MSPAEIPDTTRCALVTGASSGIGAECARLLVQHGYRVALLARRADVLRALADELGADTLVLPCDVRDAQAVERACAEIQRAFGRLDLVVNNAGAGYRARIEELDPALVARTLETNVSGVLHVCHATLPLLRASTRAVVVNVASVVGRRGIPGQAVYSASKAAVVSIGEALRLEWARENIAVCTLNPGLTSTGFFGSQANPSALPAPDLAQADSARRVALAILALDRSPRPEVSLRWKWRVFALLSVVWPRFSDRVLARRLGGEWHPR
jgi:NADP-dependent 3-hydroxy acid dehydrogenase YdfG